MRGCCPNCGMAGRIDQFADELAARECLLLALEWPAPLAEQLIRYLTLFRPPKRAMKWNRALKLMGELVRDVRRGFITRNSRDWAAPQDAWCYALNQVLLRQEQLQLPLKDHGYLYSILANSANSAEARTEAEREQKRAENARHRAPSDEDTSEPERRPPPTKFKDTAERLKRRNRRTTNPAATGG